MMAYKCDLGGQQLHLENRGGQTIVTLTSSGSGQQQQARSSFPSGEWTTPPQVFRGSHGGYTVQFHTAEGDRHVQIQGSSMQVGSAPTSTAHSLRVESTTELPADLPNMPPMQPMSPMKPMKMGNMEMSASPMTMKMGNMELSTGNAAGESRHFCSQCGTGVAPDDRFCSKCGHRLADS